MKWKDDADAFHKSERRSGPFQALYTLYVYIWGQVTSCHPIHLSLIFHRVLSVLIIAEHKSQTKFLQWLWF